MSRKRNNTVTFRMNDTEIEVLKKRVNETGITKQAYIIAAILHAKMLSKEALDDLKELSIKFSDIDKQLRGLGTNINQMAHWANTNGQIPEFNTLQSTARTIETTREECNDKWQSLRQLISTQKTTEL